MWNRELRDALVVRAPYKLLYAIICVECGAEECGANFHAVASRAAFGKAVCAFPVKRTWSHFSFSPPVSHLLTTVMLSKWLNHSFQSAASPLKGSGSSTGFAILPITPV